MRYKIIYLFIFVHSALWAQESWNTNLIDYTWNKVANSMMYREPIIFTPFELRGGYFHYGGPDYSSLSFKGGELGEHPVILDSSHVSYNGLSSSNHRNGVFVELDLVKTNFLLYLIPQNIIDVQFGLGYRMSTTLSRPDLPLDIVYENPNLNESLYEYKFSPKIYDINFNTTLNWQFSELYISYFYHSIGFSKFSLYQSEGNQKYLLGDAISETFSAGLKKLIRGDSKYNMYYGIELKTTSTTSIRLDDPNMFSPIVGFDMRSMNLNLLFGITFGGNKTIGDEGFSYLLNNEYDMAIAKFEDYIDRYPKYGKVRKAKKMINFCKSQLPYQSYNQGMKKIDVDNPEQAIFLLNEAYINADEDLKFEIDYKKKEIAENLISKVNSNFNVFPIKECERLLDIAHMASQSVHDDVTIIRAKLFFKKATLLHESDLFTDALKYYELALDHDESLSDVINIRLDALINGLLRQTEEYKEKSEYILAVESLKKVMELNSSLSYRIKPIIKSFNKLIEKSREDKTKRILEDIIIDNKSRGSKNKNITLGMTKDKVAEKMTMPDKIEFINSNYESYEIWIYNDKGQKLFFKNEKLYNIQYIGE